MTDGPYSKMENTEIPVIDISNPDDHVARQVLEAASTHGFLFIKNDGVTIPPQDIDDMFKLVGLCTPTDTHPRLIINSPKSSSATTMSTSQSTQFTQTKLAVSTAAGSRWLASLSILKARR
jgi:hypothetical protein